MIARILIALIISATLLVSCASPVNRPQLDLTPLPTSTLAPKRISAANAHQVVEIARIGDGTLITTRWSPDERELWLVTAIGIYQYDPISLTKIGFRSAPIGNDTFGLSYDGQLAAMKVSETTVRLWDIAAQHARFDFSGVNAFTLAFSPDGRLLATGGWNASGSGGLVGVWDTTTGQRLAQLEQDRRWRLDEMVFSPDGQQLATVGRNTSQQGMLLRVWNVAEAQIAGEFEAGHGHELAFTPDGAALLWGGQSWDFRTGQLLPPLIAGVEGELVLSPDATTAASLAVADKANPFFSPLVVQVWDRASGKLRWEKPAPKPTVRTVIDQLAFSPTGRWLIYLAAGQKIGVWDTAAGDMVGEMTWTSQHISSMALSPDGHTIAWSDGHYQLHLFDLAAQTALPTPPTDISEVAFSTARQLALCDRSELTVWRIAPAFEQILKLPGTHYPCDGLAFSPNSKLLIAGNNGHDVIAWDLIAKKQLPPLKGHTSSVVDVAFSRSGEFFVTASNDATVRVWRAHDRAPLSTLTTKTSLGFFGLSVALSPDDNLIAGGTSEGMVWLWDRASGQLLRKLSGHAGGVRVLAFSADGRVLAASGEDGQIHLWDSQTGAQLAILVGHTAWVVTMTFTPDGRQLLSASSDGTVRVWSASDHQVVRFD